MAKTIGLDYDDTYTTCPHAWFQAMMLMKANGFRIVGITFRYADTEAIDDLMFHKLCDALIYCGRESKFDHAKANGEEIDIWIDDHPEMLELGIPFNNRWEDNDPRMTQHDPVVVATPFEINDLPNGTVVMGDDQ